MVFLENLNFKLAPSNSQKNQASLEYAIVDLKNSFKGQ